MQLFFKTQSSSAVPQFETVSLISIWSSYCAAVAPLILHAPQWRHAKIGWNVCAPRCQRWLPLSWAALHVRSSSSRLVRARQHMAGSVWWGPPKKLSQASRLWHIHLTFDRINVTQDCHFPLWLDEQKCLIFPALCPDLLQRFTRLTFKLKSYSGLFRTSELKPLELFMPACFHDIPQTSNTLRINSPSTLLVLRHRVVTSWITVLTQESNSKQSLFCSNGKSGELYIWVYDELLKLQYVCFTGVLSFQVDHS